jgi:ATP-dependent Lhr-like helicase
MQRTWYALLAHHPAPRPIQLEAIPVLLDRREALLCAPTAGGKTEALVAAALEELAADPGADGPRMLYVAPTRALVNDTLRRLRRPARMLDLRVERRTGDERPGAKALVDALITTPESLDSMLSRAPKTLRHVRWLILDELHLVAGTARGDHLAALVARMRRVAAKAGRPLTVAGASATIADPDAVAARYLVSPVVVRVPPAHRRLDVQAVAARDLDTSVAALRRPGKTLVFVNARNAAEELAHALGGRPPFGDAVFVHHGSLVRRERERVESEFLARQHAVCVATTTLELGIDIGDVDRVALKGPPPDVSALLQRIGRAGRRTGRAEVLLLARVQSDAMRFAFLLERAAEEDLCADLGAYHPATVRQQAASLLYQNPKRQITAAAILGRLPDWQAAHWTESRLRRVLDDDKAWFARLSDGVYGPSDGLAEAYREGKMHSQVGDEQLVTVYDELTGAAVGTLGRAEPGERITLGARGGVVVSASSDAVHVRSGPAGPARFRTRRGPVMSRADAAAYLRFLGVPDGHGAVVPGAWAHGLGAAMGKVLAWALRKEGEPVRFSGGLAFNTEADLDPATGEPVWPRPPSDIRPSAIEASLDHNERALGRLTGQGPDFARLPPEERARAIRLALPVEAVRAAWRGLRWVEVSPEVTERLRVAMGWFD